MLSQTGLCVKAGVTKKKASDKLVDMIKQYKDLRHTIEQSGWGTGLNGLDEISHEDRELQTGSSKTAKEFILKRCAWYYEYEDLFSDHPGVNPPALIESEQPIRRNGRVIDDFEIGGYDQDLECGRKRLNDFYPDRENDEDESDSSSLHSFLLQIAQEKKRSMKKQTDRVPALFTGNNHNDTSNDEV